jgi:hypothetical protein
MAPARGIPRSATLWAKIHEPMVRAHALRWTSTLVSRGSSDLRSIAASNPALMREWLQELTWCREQWQREIEFFDQVIEELKVARRHTIRQAPA